MKRLDGQPNFMEPKPKMMKKICESCEERVDRLTNYEGEDFCDWCYEEVTGYSPDSEPDDVDGRHVIGKLNRNREEIIARIMNGDVLTDKEIEAGKFPRSNEYIRDLRNQLVYIEPSTRGAKHAGKMNDHFDVNVEADRRCQIEVKIANKKGSSYDVLKWQPYKDTVQFLQGQLKSANAAKFLGDCGEPMFRAWYTENIQPIAPETTYEGYSKAVFTIKMKGKQERASVDFIEYLRANAIFQKELQAKWLRFEEKWISTHTLNHAEFENVIREIIEAKDWRVCISKTQINMPIQLGV